MFDLHAFILAPTEEALLSITRDDLVRVAGHYKFELSGSPSKAELQEKLIDDLRDRGVLGKGPADESPSPTADKVPPPTPSKASIELKRLQLREMELEWEREKSIRESERQTVRERDDREHELRLKDLEFNQALRLKEMDLKAREAGILFKSEQFDVTRNIRVVPPFHEDEVDKFFAHFERVATTLKWPREVWTMTLQCVFKGKAQEAYSVLTLEDAADYEKVKQAVLRIYSLVPEAYRQRFRAYQKPDALSYVEYVREKEMRFDRWLNSQEVTTFQALRDLIVLEDFKNCLPATVATHVSEHKEVTPAGAAVLADEYVLAHKRVPSISKFPQTVFSRPEVFKKTKEAAPDLALSSASRASVPRSTSPTCGYCKKSWSCSC
ncbi:hypothetical protein N1851_033911 [Merluccius polli]|uniref:SCAN box domain-containing protein n=1 Tax=Merluccius polli TaxID=89951 RepID=A0AA47M0G6_MERPO|nr:hypothetical protein N1851_033911 [Merluccius polli]